MESENEITLNTPINNQIVIPSTTLPNISNTSNASNTLNTLNNTIDNPNQDIESGKTEPVRDYSEFIRKPFFWFPLLPCGMFAIFVVCFCWFYADKDANPCRYPIYAICLGLFLLGTYCFIVFEKVYWYGISGFYETFWYCNVSLLYCAVGILCNLPTLVGMTLIMVFFPHFGFYVDVLCYIFVRKTPFGAAGFFFDKQWPLHNKIASLHHFWYIPSVFVLFYHMPYFTYWSYVLAVIFFGWYHASCHYFIPLYAPDAYGVQRFLNIDVSYELPDCLKNIYPYKWSVGKTYPIYFTIAIFFYALPINAIAFGIILFIQYLLQ